MFDRSARSRFLTAGGVALGTFAIVRAPAPAAQFTYKLGTGEAKDFPQDLALIQMANAVKAETNGRMQIDFFPNSALGSVNSILTQVRLGSLEFMAIGNALLAAVAPVAQIFSIGFSFASSKQALDAFDGPLGAYVRSEVALKGVYVFDKTLDSGYREVTTSTRPILSADDFSGLKIRTQPAPIYVDLFKTLGAAPTPIDSNELYTALQTHIVDAQENPLVGVESFRLYEVQKYLSLTNHLWAGETLVANPAAWRALPPDIQAVVQRNYDKFVRSERRDVRARSASLLDKLKRQGLVVNAPETSSMRARLGSYYGRWKAELGTTAWSLLEAATGKLG